MSEHVKIEGADEQNPAARSPVQDLETLRLERNQLLRQLGLERENLRRAQQRIVQLRAEADDPVRLPGADNSSASFAIYETALQEAQRRYAMLQAQLLREREFRDQMQQNTSELMAALAASDQRALEYSQAAATIRKNAAQQILDMEQAAELERQAMAAKEQSWAAQRAKLTKQLSDMSQSMETNEQEWSAKLTSLSNDAGRAKREFAEKEQAWATQRVKLSNQISDLSRALEDNELELTARLTAATQTSENAAREFAAKEASWADEKQALTRQIDEVKDRHFRIERELLTKVNSAAAKEAAWTDQKQALSSQIDDLKVQHSRMEQELQSKVNASVSEADAARRELAAKEKQWSEQKSKSAAQISQLLTTLEQTERELQKANQRTGDAADSIAHAANTGASNRPGSLKEPLTSKAPPESGEGKTQASIASKPAARPDPRATIPLGQNLVSRMQLGPSARKSGDVVISAKNQSGHMVFGPYFEISPGAYAATFRLTPVSGRWFKGNSPVCAVEILSGETYLAQTHLTEKDLSKGPALLEFEVPPEMNGREFEFRVWTSGDIELYLHELSLARADGKR